MWIDGRKLSGSGTQQDDIRLLPTPNNMHLTTQTNLETAATEIGKENPHKINHNQIYQKKLLLLFLH